MMTKNDFDNLIRNAYCDHFGTNPFGYSADDTDIDYPNYLSENDFQEFISEMKNRYPQAYQKYAHAKGSELAHTANKGKNIPPKMSSIASSSRFCYLALRDGAQALQGGKVEFEFECRIDGIWGTAPQMDAYSAEGNLFIEVKCHEIFDTHNLSLSHQYYSWLCESPNGFGLKLLKPETKNNILLSHSIFGADENCMFDIKQLLCHLMGIASTSKKQPATLVYLFFKPQLTDQAIQKQVDDVFDALAAEINAIFTSKPILRFCNSNRITLRAVAQHTPVMQELKPEHIYSLF